MSVAQVVQSHLECLMQDMLGTEELIVHPNGSIGVSTEKGGYTARVLTCSRQPHIELYSVLLTEIDNDPGLLEKLNDINTRLCHTRVFWSSRRVIIAGEVVGVTADVADLDCMSDEVAGVIDHCAEDIKAVFGGRLLDEREDDE